MPKPDATASFFTRFKGWIVGLTGVFIVLPALINAAGDIYAAVLKLPRTESERINERLFREYFKKQPVATIPVPIKQNNEIVEVNFAVYERGDVFVEFGNFTQWFPFPAGSADKKKTVGFSFVSNAIAQDVPAAKGEGRFHQTERIEGDVVLRQKSYENGVIEKQTIDPRSGDILNQSARQGEKKAVSIAPLGVPTPPKIATIDLDQYRKVSQAGPAAPTLPTMDGARANAPAPGVAPEGAQLVALQSGLTWCQRKDNFLSRHLCEFRERDRFCKPEGGISKTKECKS